MRFARFIILFAVPSLTYGQSDLRLEPGAPVRGETVDIRYRPTAEFAQPLPDSVIAEVLAAGNGSQIYDVPLHRHGRTFVGSCSIPPTAQALFFRFAVNGRVDDRRGDSWPTLIVERSRTPVWGAHAQRSAALRMGGSMGFVAHRDLDRALSDAETERRLHPNAPTGWVERWKTLRDLRADTSTPLIRLELDSLLAAWSERQAEICDLLPWLAQTDQHARMIELERAWVDRDPRGIIAQSRAWREASDEPDPADRLERTEQVLRDFALTPDDAVMQALVHTAIAARLWDRADELIHRMPRKEPTLLDALVANLLAANTTIDRASVLAKEAVNAARNYDPDLKPRLVSLREYRRQRAFELPMALGTYGDALRALGSPALAEKVYAEAVHLTQANDADLNRRYVSLLVELGHNEKALEAAGTAIRAGRSDRHMLALFRQSYAAVHGSIQGIDEEFARMRPPSPGTAARPTPR